MLTQDLRDDASGPDNPSTPTPSLTTPSVPVESSAGGSAHQPPPSPGPWGDLDRHSRTLVRRSALWGGAVGLVPFILVLWDFRLDPLRTANAQKFASNFYDIQARALLHGHLSVPVHSFGIEGFVLDGRTYMYFPPFPALLRIPLLLVTDRLDGRLTAPSMLLAWSVLAAATVWLIWNVRFLVRGSSPVSRLEAVLSALLLMTGLGGSVIVFDAALPWVYHEVYLWATALTVATLASLLAVARRPTMRRVALATGLALGVILTRTTSGWAMCLTLVAFGAWLAVRQAPARRVGIVLVAGGVGALVVGAAVNWAKFRHPYMFPLERQEWTALNARRRLALRMNGGTITGRQFFLTSLVNYFRPDGIRFVPYFPFVTLPADPGRPYGGAFLDQWYRTGSVPSFMPLLFLSTVWGFVSLARRSVSNAIGPLWITLLGALAVVGGVMFYGYVSHRYTSEFLPVLIIGSTIGIVDLAHRLHARRRSLKRVAVAVTVALAAFGILASMAVGVHAARTTYRGAGLVDFVDLQARTADLTGHLDDIVRRSDTLPDDGPADQLLVVRDCDALYLATGDAYEPWLAVQSREYHVRIEPMPDGRQLGVLRLIDIDGRARRSVSLEGDGTGRIRLRMGEGFVFYPSDWVAIGPGQTVDVAVRLVTTVNRYVITLDGDEVGYVAAAETDGNELVTAAVPSFVRPSELDQVDVGFRLTSEMGPRLDVCDRLLDGLGPDG